MYGATATTSIGVRLRLRVRPVRGLASLVATALVLLSATSTSAQVRIRTRVNTPDDSRVNPYAAVLHPSEEATTLLSRAEEGIEREDWKLVVDSLQRIVELPGEHVLTTDGQMYESARRHAHRRIATLPPAGLAAYRLMFDSEAATLLKHAVERHDTSLLRTVIDKYLITRSGDDAALVLAEWLIDEGRYAEAAATLQLMRPLYPDSDLPSWVIPTRLAVCYAAMGRPQRAEAALQLLTTRPADAAYSPPEVVRQRLEALRAYMARPPGLEQEAEAAAWPVAYGRTSRDGVMPQVEPSFLENLPWRLTLPLTQPKEGFAAIYDYARENKLLPTASTVAVDNLLLVRAGSHLLALDRDTFEVSWHVSPGEDEPQAAIIEEPDQVVWQVERQRGSGNELDSDPLVRQLLRDHVGSGLAVAFGMALTIEWPGQIPSIAMDSRFPRGFGSNTFQNTFPNRVAAYKLTDGKPLWKSTIRPTDGRLGPLEFLSVPVPVGDVLLAPCRVNTDLYAVVIDPQNGDILRHVYLCGTGGGPFDSLYALSPCVADGVVYIPTGRGVIIALEARTWSIRWVVRYDRQSEHATEGRWLPTPPIAVADSLLLAPQDVDYLYCLDRATGETRWWLERGEFQYVLAADDRHVWLGGEEVQLVEVDTGRRVWTRKAGTPTGRGAVAGDRVYLPTSEGLVARHALTGEAIEVDEPAEDPPLLGNLLAWDIALYSVSLFETRKYPDLVRGYQDALARHRLDPSNAAQAMRLARMELLKHAPARALEVLAAVTPELRQTHPHRWEHLNHLRVLALLDLAASGEVSSDDALRLLEQARRTAVSTADAIDSALALGDYHRREKRLVEACLQYLALALSAEGDQMIQEGGEFHRRARSVAAQRLSDALRGLAAEQRKRLDDVVRKAFDSAISARDESSMLWLAESLPLGDQAVRAELALGAWAVEDQRYEQAEGYLTRVMRKARSPALQAEAAARLATVFLQPAELHQPVAAAHLLEKLESTFAESDLPADLLEQEMAATRPAQAGSTLRAAQIAQALRQRIDPKILARHRAALGDIRPQHFSGEPRISMIRDARPILLRDGRIEPLADQTILLSQGKEVEARSLDASERLWEAELRLLSELAVESRVEEIAAAQRANTGSPSLLTPARALVDGQTLIINSTYGIHAVGLLTGRRLWSRRFDAPGGGQQDSAGSDAWLWVHNGYVMSVDAFGKLEVAYAGDGNRVLWSRTRPGRRWFAVRARGEYVVAVDQRLEQADVFRLEDGRYLGVCPFSQGSDGNRRVNIALFDDVICGPVSPTEIVALELATPGVERWRVSTDSDLAQIFKPTHDLLAVADRAGRIQLIDPANGKRAMPSVQIDACADGVSDGVVTDGILYVCGYRKRYAGTGASSFDQQRWGLAAVRVSDGKILWQQEDIDAWAHLNADVLGASSSVVPLAVLVRSGESGQRFSNHSGRAGVAAKIELSLISKQTGQQLGDKMTVDVDADAGAWRILNVECRPDHVLVVAGAAHARFPFRAETSPGSRPAAHAPPAEDDSGPARRVVSSSGEPQ